MIISKNGRAPSHLGLGQLRPVQALVASLFFRHRRLLVSIPRQEGKTELGVRLAHDLLRRRFTKSTLFLAKDRKSGKKATYEKFERLFQPEFFDVNTERVTLKANSTSTLFTDSVDKDPDRIRGGTYGYVHWSEVAFAKVEKGVSIIDVLQKVVMPTLRLRHGYAYLESTNQGRNGWHDLWMRAEEFGFKTFRLPLSDMVYLGMVSRAEYDQLKKENQADIFAQEYECEWVSFSGAAYEEFTEDLVHDMPPPEPWQTTLYAIDWGYFPSATCVLFGYVLDGVIHIYDEHYQRREKADDTAVATKAKLAENNSMRAIGVADHEEDRIDELLLRDLPCAKANKTNVLGARMQIKELMFKKRIRVHPRCVNLIKDLRSAVWDGKRDGELDYKICTWGHYDAEAALRYLVRELSGMEQEAPIQNPHFGIDTISAQEWAMARYMEITDAITRS